MRWGLTQSLFPDKAVNSITTASQNMDTEIAESTESTERNRTRSEVKGVLFIIRARFPLRVLRYLRALSVLFSFGLLGRDYRFRVSSSWSIWSEVWMVLELAWKPRSVTIMSVICSARSTLDISRLPAMIEPLPAMPEGPMLA